MKKKVIWIKIFILSVFGIIAFCSVAVAFGIFPISAVPISFIGACLGAIISAIITQVLLSGQTEREEIKHRNVKVFEKKSKEFEDYIEILRSILDKQSIDIDDY